VRARDWARARMEGRDGAGLQDFGAGDGGVDCGLGWAYFDGALSCQLSSARASSFAPVSV
jgi:hypothetical protein